MEVIVVTLDTFQEPTDVFIECGIDPSIGPTGPVRDVRKTPSVDVAVRTGTVTIVSGYGGVQRYGRQVLSNTAVQIQLAHMDFIVVQTHLMVVSSQTPVCEREIF
jgi:propanediol dehydratase large subunit